MTTPKFRYLIITEDGDVYGTNDEGKATAYVDDLSIVIDVEKMVYRDFTIDEAQIEEVPDSEFNE